MLGRRKRRARDESAAGYETYRGLRSLALESVEAGLAPPRPDHVDVSGLVVDIPASGGFATIVALTDHTTSMYTSVGGGTIGAGEHRAVADVNKRLLTVVQAHLGLFKRRGDGELPSPGHVRFHVLTASGTRQEDVSEDSFWGRAPSELMPVIAAAQELMTAIREASP